MAFALYNRFKCNHYQRKCKLVTPCCYKTYTCHFCHDEQESHTVDRKSIKEVVCMVCEERQSVRNHCSKCKTKFGEYFCRECKVFDDEEKGQFHCKGCGICRRGGSNMIYRCKICNMRLPFGMLRNHKCTANRSRTNCPVCIDDMHNSRIKLQLSPCVHLLRETYEYMKRSGYTKCPFCNQKFQ